MFIPNSTMWIFRNTAHDCESFNYSHLKQYAMPHKTQRYQFEDIPCCSSGWDDWCEETMLWCLLQLNSMAMSGGIYLYDKVKNIIFSHFKRKQAILPFQFLQVRIWMELKKLQYCSLKQWLKYYSIVNVH